MHMIQTSLDPIPQLSGIYEIIQFMVFFTIIGLNVGWSIIYVESIIIAIAIEAKL